MYERDKPDPMQGTMLDPEQSRNRLKEGLVPSDTGIFLRVEKGAGAGRVYTLSRGGVHLVGRDGADIVVEDAKVSRRHAEIGLYGPGAYVIRDLASTNGTWLNGRRVVEKAKLSGGDRIRVGDTEIVFYLAENAIPVG